YYKFSTANQNGRRNAANHRINSLHFLASVGDLHPQFRLQYSRCCEYYSVFLLLFTSHHPCSVVLLLPRLNTTHYKRILSSITKEYN
ncbi:hypothetical protein V3C99_018778, partial [Haemonchus contortus]|uniref:Ovule protein n=1 Tax=Haemonchus contortus TaxID=6289 RepID=A0A7I4Z1Z8_HAECO